MKVHIDACENYTELALTLCFIAERGEWEHLTLIRERYKQIHAKLGTRDEALEQDILRAIETKHEQDREARLFEKAEGSTRKGRKP